MTSRARGAAKQKATTSGADLPWPSLAELSVAFSQLLSLSEGKASDHAHRVCYIATNICNELDLNSQQMRSVFLGALFHDIGDIDGVQAVAASLSLVAEPSGTSELGSRGLQVDEALRRHCTVGPQLVSALGIPPEVARIVASHHERWNGSGYPAGLFGEATPRESRVVAIADATESLLSQDASALHARRRIPDELNLLRAVDLDPDLTEVCIEMTSRDEFWVQLYSADLGNLLVARANEFMGTERRDGTQVVRFAEVFAVLGDAKGSAFRRKHSHRSARIASLLAEHLDLDPAVVCLAAVLQDVGTLAIPSRVLSKADVLSKNEADSVMTHPATARVVLESLSGLERIARWIAFHHERPDGRGYPYGLEATEIPLESYVLSVAGAFVALTSPRQYRAALSAEDAKQVLEAGAGTQFDANVVAALNVAV